MHVVFAVEKYYVLGVILRGNFVGIHKYINQKQVIKKYKYVSKSKNKFIKNKK
jgi:hypothetical protein